MNRKYYLNNMWWGWFMGGYTLYMSWDYEFKLRLSLPSVHPVFFSLPLSSD